MKTKNKNNYRKLEYQDLYFTDHAIERLQDRSNEFHYEGYNIKRAIEEQFKYFKRGSFDSRIQEVAVQARKYFGQHIMFNERMNLMMAVEHNGSVCTVMSIKKNGRS